MHNTGSVDADGMRPDFVFSLRTNTLTKAYSSSAAKTKTIQAEYQTSSALRYDTLTCLDVAAIVVIVRTVVTPRDTRAGSEFLLIQKPTHDNTTISCDGMYDCRMK